MRRKGLAPLILAMIVTAVGMVLGVSHFAAARHARLTGHRQADWLQARYLAQAGMHKAMLVLRREHQMGMYRWRFPYQRDGKYVPEVEFSGEIDGGRFEVLKVEPHVLDPGGRDPVVLVDRPVIRRGRVEGHYDAYVIEALGRSAGDRQRVKVSAIVKLTRVLVPPSAEEP